MASRIARKIVKSVLSREQMDGDGARGMYSLPWCVVSLLYTNDDDCSLP